MKVINKLYLLFLLLIIAFFISSCCKSKPDLPWCEPLTVEKFTPESILHLCPTHKGGDRDFEGNGPSVTAHVYLSKKNNDKEVWATIYLHAKETTPDWTEV
jgi:hypothetical protein